MGVSTYSITLGVGRKHINGLIIELDKDKTLHTGYWVSKIHVKQRYFDVVKKKKNNKIWTKFSYKISYNIRLQSYSIK